MLSLLGCTKIVIGRYEDEGYYYTRKAEYITWMYKGTCEEYKYTENKACRKFDKEYVRLIDVLPDGYLKFLI